MANLVPGFLFRTPGLNRNFTHLPNTITPKDQEKISGRQSFHRHSWSTDNPVTRVYDVSDTNNNNYRTSSRLSGYDKTEFTRIPDPDRHFRAFCTTKPSTHRNCYDSVSIYKKPGIQTNVDCLQRAHTWSPGVQSMEYVKYMRYINQSKTGPLPSKTGWSRPMRLPNVVDSVDSTNDTSPKQQTPDEKTQPSSEMIQKSQSDQVGNSKYETKKQIIPEQEKRKSTKQAISTDHTVTGTRSHNRSRLSSLTSRTSRNEPARSQTSSRSQENTQRGGDINSKDEPKDVVVTCIETKGENSDKHLFSVGENEERQTNHKEGVDIPMSQSSRVSPMGSVQEKDQKPKDFKQGEAADEMDKKSNEYDSHPSTVLSVLGHVERPESEKTTSSKGKGAEEQMHIDHVQETKSKSGNKAESLVSIRSNHIQQIYRACRDKVDKDTDEGASKDVHRKCRDSGGEDSRREGNKEIHRAQSDSEEAEDDNSETRRGSREIYGAQRNSVDTEDEKGERKRGSGEIHRARDSKEAEDDKGEARRGSEEIHRSQRNTEETEDNKGEARRGSGNMSEARADSFVADDDKEQRFQRESNDGMNRRSQEHNSHPLTAGRPETGKTSSREVQEKLQEDQKSIDFEDKEYADEMSKKSKEQDSLPSTFESVQKTSNIVHEKLQEKDQKISTVERPKSETSPSNKVYEALQGEDQNSTDFKQRGSADEINKMSRAYDSHLSTEDSSKSGKKTSVEEDLQGKDQKSTDFYRGESADEMKIMSQGLDPRPSAVERPNSGKSTSVHEKVQVQDQKLVDLDQRESI